MKMDTGSFKMAPLSDFTVTFTDHSPKKKQKVRWDQWYEYAGTPDYDLVKHRLIFKDCKGPGDYEIEMPWNDPPYELVWSK